MDSLSQKKFRSYSFPFHLISNELVMDSFIMNGDLGTQAAPKKAGAATSA